MYLPKYPMSMSLLYRLLEAKLAYIKHTTIIRNAIAGAGR
jgi:hypothetical protein